MSCRFLSEPRHLTIYKSHILREHYHRQDEGKSHFVIEVDDLLDFIRTTVRTSPVRIRRDGYNRMTVWLDYRETVGYHAWRKRYTTTVAVGLKRDNDLLIVKTAYPDSYMP
jgi:hypothetical protein